MIETPLLVLTGAGISAESGVPTFRGEDGLLRLLSNVCTHRGMLVVTEEARCSGLRCPYHGRRFGLDGRFKSMPRFDEVRGFPSPREDLTTVAVEGGLFPRLPVRTAEPVPKPLVRQVCEQLRAVRMVGPVSMGDVVLSDVAGTGVDVIATRDLPRRDLGTIFDRSGS